MALLAAAVTLTDKYLSLLEQLYPFSKGIAVAGSTLSVLCLFIALILSFRSINPSNNPNEHINIGDWLDRPPLQYYLTGLVPAMRWEDYLWDLKDSKLNVSASDYYNVLMKSAKQDLLQSLTCELLKLSYIKEKKIHRSKASLKWIEVCIWVAGLTVVGILLTENFANIPFRHFGSINVNAIFWLMVGHIIGDF